MTTQPMMNIERQLKKKSGHITMPKKYIGHKVIIAVKDNLEDTVSAREIFKEQMESWLGKMSYKERKKLFLGLGYKETEKDVFSGNKKTANKLLREFRKMSISIV